MKKIKTVEDVRDALLADAHERVKDMTDCNCREDGSHPRYWCTECVMAALLEYVDGAMAALAQLRQATEKLAESTRPATNATPGGGE